MSDPKSSLTYRDAGVDIDAGNALVDAIKPLAAATSRPGSMSGLGGFGALFDLKAAGFADPILVAATDGVGTKLRIAIDTGRLETIGIDLVAMCVNDLICQGAEPLFFLDYFATGKLDTTAAAQIISGIAKGCKDADCALIGGETAEMPGMYAPGDFDLAGFAVGAMERGAHLPQGVREGDVLIGLSATGPHSNGYSLIRKIVERAGLTWDNPAPFNNTQTLGEALLAPTALYTRAAKAALPHGVHALAHITGGGLTENLPRALPEGLGATLELNAWPLPPVFHWLISEAQMDEAEALKTFNCGIGLVLIVAREHAQAAGSAADAMGHQVAVIGEVTRTPGLTFTGALS